MGNRDDFVEWITAAFGGTAEAGSGAAHINPAALKQVGETQILGTLAQVGGGRTLKEVVDTLSPNLVLVVLDGEPAAIRVECAVDAEWRLMGLRPLRDNAFDGSVGAVLTSELSEADRRGIHELFEVAYADANHDYLDASLGLLRWAALAHREGKVVGFALGEQRVINLPHYGPTQATLAGLACIDESVRRRGLFGQLANMALIADGHPPNGPVIGAGRMAHPASMRVFRGRPTLVPMPGVVPTAVQQGVGAAIAAAYGVTSFDPETFVCIGKGTPIGYPRMEQEVEPEEWVVFEPVDRDRGDALLAILWQSYPPEDW